MGYTDNSPELEEKYFKYTQTVSDEKLLEFPEWVKLQPKTKICTICNKPLKLTHPAQKYHFGKCASQAERNRTKRYRNKKVEASQNQSTEK